MPAPRPANPSSVSKLRLSLCAVLFLAAVPAVHAQTPKIGTVDIGKVFSAYYRTKEAEKTMLDSQAGAKKELDERLEKRRQLLEVVQSLNRIADGPTLSAGARSNLQKQREEKISQLRQIEKELNQFKETREREMQDLTKRNRGQIVEEIMVVIDAKVKSGNYDLVLNKSGQGTNRAPVVLYGSDKLDFTDDVIAVLNQNRAATR